MREELETTESRITKSKCSYSEHHNTWKEDYFGNGPNRLSYKKTRLSRLLKKKKKKKSFWEVILLSTVCVIVHGREKWPETHWHFLQHHRRKKKNRTMSNKVPQTLWHWFNARSLGFNITHTLLQKQADIISLLLLHQSSKSIADATIKKPLYLSHFWERDVVMSGDWSSTEEWCPGIQWPTWRFQEK